MAQEDRGFASMDRAKRDARVAEPLTNVKRNA